MTNNTNSCVKEGCNPLTPIQEFYNGKKILVTGATGFLGKVLIEKLLRSCPSVGNIYILTRSKKGKSVNDRVKDLLNDFLFDKVRKETPDFTSKIIPVPGDCALPGLGMSEEDRELLIENVDVVFHAAATVRFDEKLKTAMQTNVLATQEILSLCHSMKNLEAVVYVSTAYSFCYKDRIEEKVYDSNSLLDKAMTLIKVSTDQKIEAETKKLIGEWPNTYTFTKGLAENLVVKSAGNLPVCIFRPAIVTATFSEPVPGWVDNVLGPTGIILGAGCGVVRTFHCKKEIEANFVPADMVINAMLALGKETARRSRKDNREIKVYNFVSSTDNPVTYETFMQYLEKFGVHIPSIKAVWYYSLIITRSRSLTIFLCLVLHLLPSLLIDFGSILIGKKPQMTKLYNKVHKLIGALSYFTTRQWVFEFNNIRDLWNNTSTEDKKKFNFHIPSIKWEPYSESYVRGARLYVLKEDLSNLSDALKKWNRLYWYHQILKITFHGLLLTLCWYYIQRSVITFI